MKEKLTMIECFNGIGAQKRGIDLTNLFDLQVICTSDIDKDAILSYASMHCGLTLDLIKNYNEYPSEEKMIEQLTKANIGYDPQKHKEYDWNKHKKDVKKYWLACRISNQWGDISRINNFPYADLLTFSFPCQSISIAGKQEGIIEGETKSGLVYEVLRILQNMKDNNNLPKYLLLENVKNLVGSKFINDFNNLNAILDEIGYNVYWKILNGKNCGVPQNRERVFGIYIRKDIDNKTFEFPIPFDNGLRLKDILEDNVDENFYISKYKKVNLVNENEDNLKEQLCNKLLEDNLVEENDVIRHSYSISRLSEWDKRGVECNNSSPTITTRADTLGVVVKDERMSKQALETFNNNNCNYTDTINPFNKQVNNSGIIPTLTTRPEGFKTAILPIDKDLRIRKLTPTECFKLMGFEKDDIEKCYNIGLSNAQLYKQAGNSIITNCIALLFEHLYKAQSDSKYTCIDEKIISKQLENNNIKVVGNYMPSNHDASRIVDTNGIAPTVKENHGTVTGILQRNFINPQVK